MGVSILSISLNQVRKSVSQYWEGEISQDTIIYIRDILEDVLTQISKEVVREIEERNYIREKVNLPVKKRIKASSIKMISVKVYKSVDDSKCSEVGQNNRDTTLQEADEVI